MIFCIPPLSSFWARISSRDRGIILKGVCSFLSGWQINYWCSNKIEFTKKMKQFYFI